MSKTTAFPVDFPSSWPPTASQPDGSGGPAPKVDPLPQAPVGQRLRLLRTQKNFSIRALAEKSGLNVNTLSLIENGKTSPSVHTLQQLARALEMPVSAFFETDAPRLRLVYLKADQHVDGVFAHGTLADLGAGMAERLIEPFLITLKPDAGSGRLPIVHAGHEFVYCIRGRLLYFVEDQPYTLMAGDSLLFDALLPHRWQNGAPEVSQALLVMCPAGAHGHSPVEHVASN